MKTQSTEVTTARAAAETEVAAGLASAKTVDDAVRAADQLVRSCGTATPRLDAELIVGHVLGLDRVQLHVQAEQSLPEDRSELVRAIARRKANEPVAYILGTAHFRNVELAVDERVLIPRGETELLVEWALEELAEHGGTDVIDVCTGSGAVAIAIADEGPDTLNVSGAELSQVAVDLAIENGERCNVDVAWSQGDLMDPVQDQQFDVIVANPPYVKFGSHTSMHPSVTWYEPDVALYGDEDDEFGIIRRLLAQAKATLRPGGFIAMECGAGTADMVAEIIENAGFVEIEQRKDLRGIERAVGGRKPLAAAV